MRGPGRNVMAPSAPIAEVATRLGLVHHANRLECACGRCSGCARLLEELLRDVVFWKGQAKTAIRLRDELDRTLLSMDGGVGHWRRMTKTFSTLLNVTRNELNALRSPGRYRRTPEAQFTELVERLSSLTQAAIDREEDVEQRLTRARDLLYRLKKTAGVDTPIGHELHRAWETL